MRWEQVQRLGVGKFRRLVGVSPPVFAQMREVALAQEPPSTHPVKGAKRGPKPKLALEERLLMLLMSYREYRTFAHFGASFGVSETPCWRIVTLLEVRSLADDRFHLVGKQALRSHTHWQGVVIDVGECAVERPKKSSAPTTRAKKKRHTLKAQVLLERGSRRILALRVGKGWRHDFHLCKQSRVRVHPGVPINVETGYQGLQKVHANTYKPAKATKKHPLSREQKLANRQINSRRVVIEHAIRRLKVFRLLGERYRHRRRRFGLRLNLIATLTNLDL